jgi:hypothetical protein
MDDFEQKLEAAKDLRDEIETLLYKLENSIDDYQNLLHKIQDAERVNLESTFAPFIAAGLIPGAYFALKKDEVHAYKIVSIKGDCYGAADVNSLDNVLVMPLEVNGNSCIDKFILLDEKTAMERASKYDFLSSNHSQCTKGGGEDE